MLRSTSRRVRAFISASILSAMLAAAVPASAESEAALDFPPGSFSDGQRYSLADMEGKVVVLFFYEKDCPRCRNEIPARNKIVDQFAGKPVKFFAIAAGDTLADARSYVAATRLKMTTYSDPFGLMQRRFDTGEISLNNIWQFRVVGPTGKIVARSMEPDAIERAITDAKWKYKDGGYDARLNPIVDALEWGQYVPAVRELRKYTKSGAKPTQESANKLWEVLTTEAKGWMDDAAKSVETDPIKAYDIYTKVSAAFVGEELGKQADAALKTLKTNKAIVDELAARKMFDTLTIASARVQPNQKEAFVTQARAIAKKFADTPTGKKAEALAAELEG